MNTGACVEFLQRLIQTTSLPGREGDLARLVRQELESLRYDDVSIDEVGNVIGHVRGRGQAPPTVFNSHLDHVDAGDVTRWPYPPFGGEIHDGRVWGRGAVDAKGPLAAQVFGIGQLGAEHQRPPGDVYVTAVVQAEAGGLGARHLLRHLKAPFAIMGAPSNNEVRRGHRGRTEVVLHIQGRSVHASVPESGCNPLEVAADFILRLKRLRMRDDRELGVSTVTPTVIRTDQAGTNVVPGAAWLTCDWRTVPGESAGDVQLALKRIAEECLIDGAGVDVYVEESVARSYTGVPMRVPGHHPSFLLPAGHPAVQAAQRALESAMGTAPPSRPWRFATDGGLFAEAGHLVVGFGPGDETLAHTSQESIEIASLERAIAGNRALALQWAATATE